MSTTFEESPALAGVESGRQVELSAAGTLAAGEVAIAGASAETGQDSIAVDEGKASLLGLMSEWREDIPDGQNRDSSFQADI